MSGVESAGAAPSTRSNGAVAAGMHAAGPRAALPRCVDVAIVGGGLIGLGIGWRLAAAGLSVAVFDRGDAGAASPVASGMLAAAAELEPASSELFRLAVESQRLWPAFRTALEAAAAADIDYREHGTLVVAIGRDEVDRLRFRYDLQQREGAVATWLAASAVRDMEPCLRPSVTAGIHCPADHQVDPRLVLDALRKALRGAGGQLFEHCPVDGIETQAGRATAVATAHGPVRATTIVIATGAWSGTPGFLPAGIDIPVRPVKGQALSLQAARGTALPTHVVWTDLIHVAPKAGRLVIGASVEDCGFDTSRTAGGLYALLEAARRILPNFEELRIEAHQVGFRPTSADDAPILGGCGVPGLVLATGHHRNGYLLAPVSIAAVEDLVLRGRLPDAALPFGLDRFRRAPRPESERESNDADHRQRASA